MGRVCPKCGAEMELRMAKKGPNAGKQFWGCSKYPICRGILAYDDTNGTGGGGLAPAPAIGDSLRSLPRPVMCRARESLQQVRLFESIALPLPLLKRVRARELAPDDSLWQFLSQWRLDFPTSIPAPYMDGPAQRTLAVLEKVLLRGRMTVLSESLESCIAEIVGASKETLYTTHDIQTLTESWPFPLPSFALDSPAETSLFESVLRLAVLCDPWLVVIPQVSITSLVEPELIPEEMDRRRVDFMVWRYGHSIKLVIEVDGQQHADQMDADEARDVALQKSGYRVLRVPAQEALNGSGESLNVIQQTLEDMSRSAPDAPRGASLQFLKAIVVAHQVQLTLLEGVECGMLPLRQPANWAIESDLAATGWFATGAAEQVVSAAVADFTELLRAIAAVHGVETDPGGPAQTGVPTARSNPMRILFDPRSSPGPGSFHVMPCSWPCHLAMSFYSPPEQISPPLRPEPKTLEYLLRYVFRFEAFGEGQLEGIQRLLTRKDAVVLLPTGAGKSLVYQLASLLLPGRTIVVDPLLSLMDDQISNLEDIGIDRCATISSTTSTETRAQLMRLIGQGEFLFAFVSPERFQIREFREALRALTAGTCISAVVIDEAHCVSEWGHDFRPAYLNLGKTAREYCSTDGHVPPILGLTGTASRAVLRDIQRELQIEDFDAVITPNTFDRPNLHFSVLAARSSEKWARLQGFLGQRLPSMFGATPSQLYDVHGEATFSGLVFCPHVKGDFGVVSVAEKLTKELGIPASYYSGKSPWKQNPFVYARQKADTAWNYKHNKIPVLACTNAFGMGIDKPNIRYTVHFGIPASIESFYQEAGRAGRRRIPLEPAYCCVLVSNDDPRRAERLLSVDTPVEDIARELGETKRDEYDDAMRMLWFHVHAFRGVQTELSDLERVLSVLEPLGKRHQVVVPFDTAVADEDMDGSDSDNDVKTMTEKALHRLLVIGVVEDYTADHSAKQFTVAISGIGRTEMLERYADYVAGYLPSMRAPEKAKAETLPDGSDREFVRGLGALLLDFVYTQVEQSRRRNLAEMLRACQHSGDDDLRESILRYLERTQFSDSLDAIVADAQAGLYLVQDTAGSVTSPNEAAQLRGQVSRYLGSYATHPGLLMLRAISESLCRDGSNEIVRREFLNAVDSALSRLHLDQRSVLYDFAGWGLSVVAARSPELGASLTEELLRLHPDRNYARYLTKAAPSVRCVPAWFLLERLAKTMNDKIL
jgi:ATP-dependent DNA helicase RecQ